MCQLTESILNLIYSVRLLGTTNKRNEFRGITSRKIELKQRRGRFRLEAVLQSETDLNQELLYPGRPCAVRTTEHIINLAIMLRLQPVLKQPLTKHESPSPFHLVAMSS